MQIVAFSCFAIAAFFHFAFQDKSFVFLSIIAGVIILVSIRSGIRAIEVDDVHIRVFTRSSSVSIRWDDVSSVRVDVPPGEHGHVELRGSQFASGFDCRNFVDGDELYRVICSRLHHVEFESFSTSHMSRIIPYFWLPLVKRRRTIDK